MSPFLMASDEDALEVESTLSEIVGQKTARKLLAQFGSLNAIAREPMERLADQDGMSEKKAERLNVAFRLAGVLVSESTPAPQLIETPSQLANFVREKFRRLSVEQLRVVLLNCRNHVIRDMEIVPGSVGSPTITPHEVLRPAVQFHASAIAIVHNHPSGDPEPSPQDIRFTRELAQAGRILRIPLHDHVIVGRMEGSRSCDYVSLRQMGYLPD